MTRRYPSDILTIILKGITSKVDNIRIISEPDYYFDGYTFYVNELEFRLILDDNNDINISNINGYFVRTIKVSLYNETYENELITFINNPNETEPYSRVIL
jgi:hypothetical protein